MRASVEESSGLEGILVKTNPGEPQLSYFHPQDKFEMDVSTQENLTNDEVFKACVEQKKELYHLLGSINYVSNQNYS